ncbi:MAG: hypothetical protein OXR66_04170 [Candidatus Woesearchaeota archaeon]|nr:hypothetical protein [Candidatus Woesearchaeota archaeon]
MKESEIRAKIGDGWLRVIMTLEVAGKPKEHIEETLDKYIENIDKDERIEVLIDDREPAEEHEDGMFTAFSELEMIVDNMETLTWLCVNFSPASIEVIDPETFQIEGREITNWLNDLLAKIHEISKDYREKLSGNEYLTRAMNQLIQNSVILSLKTGNKTEEELVKETGLIPDTLKPFLKHLVEKKHITKKGKEYSL